MIVIVFALISTLQCTVSLVKSAYFAKMVKAFFIRKFKCKLKFHHLLPLFNLWFIMVVISNILVIVGSVMKILLSLNVRFVSIITFTHVGIVLNLIPAELWRLNVQFWSQGIYHIPEDNGS